MNLPHQKPIRFANEVLSSCDNKIIVSCKFPFSPTLAMACEAAAQSSAGFAQESSDPKIGFLVSLKDILLIEDMNFTEAIVEIERTFDFGSMSEYSFELKNNDISYVSGKITIALDKK